jgi:hypothetical protein
VKPKLVFAIILIYLFFILSCPTDNSKPASDLHPIEQSSNVVSSDICKAADILPQVDALLTGFTSESHYLIIRHQFVLSIWLVIPELNPYAPKDEIETNSRLAFVKGIRICHTVASSIPCVRKVFNAINPMIVDDKFNCWYRDIIPLQNLPSEENPSDEELIQSAIRRNMKYSYSRTVPPQTKAYTDILSIPAWQEFRTSIQQILCKKRTRCNCAAYPMFLKDYCIVQVYWEALSEWDFSDMKTLERMAQIAQSFAGIELPIARLDMSVVNREGKLTVYGKADGHALHAGADIFSLKDEIRLYHMP